MVPQNQKATVKVNRLLRQVHQRNDAQYTIITTENELQRRKAWNNLCDFITTRIQRGNIVYCHLKKPYCRQRIGGRNYPGVTINISRIGHVSGSSLSLYPKPDHSTGIGIPLHHIAKFRVVKPLRDRLTYT